MKIHYLSLALLGALSLCLPGCSNDDTLPQLAPDNGSEGVTAYLSVTAKGVPTFAQSRWDDLNHRPSKENSGRNEGVIHDVLLFIYDGTISSAAANQKALQVEHLNVIDAGSTTSDGEKIYNIPTFALDDTKIKLSGSEASHTYRVFVVANPDATLLADAFTKADLTAIRDWDYTGPIFTASSTASATQPSNVGDVSGFDRFVMSSDQECTMTLTQAIVDSHGAVAINDGNPILVERLAARIDISFGKPQVYNNDGEIVTDGTIYLDASDNRVTFDANGAPSATIAKVELPVYDYTAYKAGELIRLHDRYVITDVDVEKAVTNAQRLIQHNSAGYFQGETWLLKGTADTELQTYNGQDVRWEGYYCERPTTSADSYTYTDEDHSLANLIVGNNNLYTHESGLRYYTLGYYRENVKNDGVANNYDTTVANRTKVIVTGTYYKARDLDTPHQDIPKNIDFVIRHCHLTSKGVIPHYIRSMAYAVGRNTIYRLRIDKILADTDNVYVIWYYNSDNDADHKFDPYTEIVTPFSSYIVGKNDVPND